MKIYTIFNPHTTNLLHNVAEIKKQYQAFFSVEKFNQYDLALVAKQDLPGLELELLKRKYHYDYNMQQVSVHLPEISQYLRDYVVVLGKPLLQKMFCKLNPKITPLFIYQSQRITAEEYSQVILNHQFPLEVSPYGYAHDLFIHALGCGVLGDRFLLKMEEIQDVELKALFARCAEVITASHMAKVDVLNICHQPKQWHRYLGEKNSTPLENLFKEYDLQNFFTSLIGETFKDHVSLKSR